MGRVKKQKYVVADQITFQHRDSVSAIVDSVVCRGEIVKVVQRKLGLAVLVVSDQASKPVGDSRYSLSGRILRKGHLEYGITPFNYEREVPEQDADSVAESAWEGEESS